MKKIIGTILRLNYVPGSPSGNRKTSSTHALSNTAFSLLSPYFVNFVAVPLLQRSENPFKLNLQRTMSPINFVFETDLLKKAG